MPELPEVEVTRASLAQRLDGARVLEVHLGKPLRWPLGCEPHALVGLRAGTMARRGKYLWLPLTAYGAERGAEPLAQGMAENRSQPRARGGLLWHLGMSGSLNLSDAPQAVGRHDHFVLITDRGSLRLTDPRRFGAVIWSEALDRGPAASRLAGLGPEPFDPLLTPSSLHEALKLRRAPIKTVLLAGEVVVGAGNIYASEALFKAGIDPRTPSHAIGLRRCERLLAALRTTLGRAIELGGSTLRDFRDAHGTAGAFQDEALVYGRAGHACTRCGHAIRRLVQAQRSTFYCPCCQRR